MDHEKARDFVENLIDRLERDVDKFRLPGGLLTRKEVEALELLISRSTKLSTPLDHGDDRQNDDAILLNLSCLDANCSDEWVLCVDFGTAFSKAALWDQRPALRQTETPIPVPLPIGQGLSLDPLLVDSVVYVTHERVYFGSEAITQYERDSDPKRQLFDSPKEVLTLDFSTLQFEKPSPECDPTGKFKKKDLLVLFLGYLTALSIRELQNLGHTEAVKRRFATPGWNDAQERSEDNEYNEIIAQMRRFLAEAQILAETFEIDDWINGLSLAKAAHAISELTKLSNAVLGDNQFVDRPVLEAAASASSIKEKLLNKRPQVMVVDVGAGTTDIGVFKYVGSDENPKFAAYTNGFAALRMAGKRLDEAFKSMVKLNLDIDSSSTAYSRLERNLARNIHEYKRALFEKGEVTVEVEGLPDTVVTLDKFLATKIVQHFKSKFSEKIRLLLENADGAGGKSFTDVSTQNYVVFTGGGGALPFLREAFHGGVNVGTKKAYFEVIDPRPEWLADMGEAVQLVFPQISVSVGGASPDLPKQLPTIGDTSTAAPRSLAPNYKS